MNTNRDQQISDRESLQKVLDSITMENTSLDFNWKFEVISCNDADSPGWFVNVAFERPDTNTGEIGVGRGRKEFVPVGTTESGVVKTCWLLMELVVRHELMEAFHWQGKRIFNPHTSVHALASINEE